MLEQLAQQRVEQQDGHHHRERGRQPRREQVGHRLVGGPAAPPVEGQHLLGVDAQLHPPGFVQAELLADLVDALGGGGLARQDLGRVAAEELEQEEHQQQHADQPRGAHGPQRRRLVLILMRPEGGVVLPLQPRQRPEIVPVHGQNELRDLEAVDFAFFRISFGGIRIRAEFPMVLKGRDVLERADEADDPYWNVAPEPRRRLLGLLARPNVRLRGILSGHLHRPIAPARAAAARVSSSSKRRQPAPRVRLQLGG